MAINIIAHQEVLNRSIQRVRKAQNNTWTIYGIQDVDFSVPCGKDDELILFVLAEGYGDGFRQLLTPKTVYYLYINNASMVDQHQSTRRLSLVYWVGSQLDENVVSSYAFVFALIENIIRRRDSVLIASAVREILNMQAEYATTDIDKSTESLTRRHGASISTLGGIAIDTRSRARSLPIAQQMNIALPQSSRNLKIIIIGNAGIGKTSITRFLCEGIRPDNNAPHAGTIGIDVFSKRMSVDGRTVTLDVIDTAGQERFSPLPRAYYRNANGVVLVYSFDDHDSFLALENWLNHARQNTLDCRPAFIIIGNKNDIEAGDRKVSNAEVSTFCRQKGIVNFETSARTGDNINEAFTQLIRTYYFSKMDYNRSPIRHIGASGPNQVNVTPQQNDIIRQPDVVNIVQSIRDRSGSRPQTSWVQDCCFV